MKRLRWATSIIAASLLLVSSTMAAVIYQEDFGGSGGPLNGTSPDISTTGAVWEAGSTWLDNGVAGTTVASSTNGQAAHLDLTVETGKKYIAEATIFNNQSNWIGFGFTTGAEPADWTVTDASVRHNNAGGAAWVLTRNSTGNDQEGFRGANTGGAQPWNGDVADPTQPIDFKIILDNTGAVSTAEWFINGTSMGVSAYGSLVLNVNGIGFSHDRSATANNGSVISNFRLSVVPEPSAAALAGLLLVGAAALKRRRRLQLG